MRLSANPNFNFRKHRRADQCLPLPCEQFLCLLAIIDYPLSNRHELGSRYSTPLHRHTLVVEVAAAAQLAPRKEVRFLIPGRDSRLADLLLSQRSRA